MDLKLEEVPTLVKFVTQIMHRTTPSTLKALASPAATPSPGLVNAYQAFTPLPMGDGLEFGPFFTRIQTNQRALPIEKQRMEMSTKRLFHYKQEMRAFDW